MKNGSPLPTQGHGKTAGEVSLRRPWHRRIDFTAAFLIIVALLGYALWESRAVVIGASVLGALGLLLASMGLSSLRAVHGDRLAAAGQGVAVDGAAAAQARIDCGDAAASGNSQDRSQLAQRCASLEAANRALSERLAFSLSLFDSRTEPVAVLDEDGVIIAANAAWNRCAAQGGLHYPLGSNYLHLCEMTAGGPNGAGAAAAAAGVRAVLDGASEDFRHEYPCQANDSERWFTMHITPLRGARRGVLVVHEDISRRKSEQGALMHCAAIVETTEDAIVGKTLDGLITSWNKAAERIFGYSSEEALGQHISLITPETYRGEELAMLETIREGAALKHYQTVRRTKDGRQIRVSVTVSPMRDAAGDVIGASKIFRDISEHQLAEQELRIAAAAFEANQAMMVTDANCIILRVNQAFTTSTGYGAAEVVGRHVRLLNSGRQSAGFYSQMWKTIFREGSWQGEIWNRRKNGEIYPEWLTITSVKNLEGLTTHFVAIHTDITARKAAEDEIRNLAYYDPLTHLPNRRMLMDCLHQAQVGCARLDRLGALIFIDLDNFKTLNDTQGHDQGDLLLQQVGQRLRECVREGDTVSRLGGDEFVVVVENLSKEIDEAARQAEIVSEKILAAFKRTYLFDGREFHCTASIGLTLFGHKPETMEVLMMQADFAMYQAKAGGRNAYRFFDPVMQAAVTARNLLEKELRQAVREAEFVLYYQAQVDGQGRLAGAEALVRWQHGQRGIVEPDDFIPLAEETGLIRPLGHAVLAAACAQLAAWAQRPAMAHLSVAVNISAREFAQSNFVEQVLGILAATGANPQRLKLELTESLLVADVGDVIAKMRALKRAGVGFALDDFGTGYSSLAYLNQLPLDQLKIDRSFVLNIESDASAALICAATINLAHSLNLQVVAEGVETAAQRHLLSTVHQCDFMQGYLFSAPLPVHEFERFAEQRGAPVLAA